MSKMKNLALEPNAQLIFERDLAVAQLKELGLELGEKNRDVVHVVRCKNCKYGKSGGFDGNVLEEGVIVCLNSELTDKLLLMYEHDFCSYGEEI